jgi:hypothetical protein
LKGIFDFLTNILLWHPGLISVVGHPAGFVNSVGTKTHRGTYKIRHEVEVSYKK